MVSQMAIRPGTEPRADRSPAESDGYDERVRRLQFALGLKPIFFRRSLWASPFYPSLIRNFATSCSLSVAREDVSASVPQGAHGLRLVTI